MLPSSYGSTRSTNTYSGVRIRMDLDRRNLWSERGDIAIHKLWESPWPPIPTSRHKTSPLIGISSACDQSKFSNQSATAFQSPLAFASSMSSRIVFDTGLTSSAWLALTLHE